MPELLNENIKQQVREVFAQLKEPVQILFFSSRQNCDYCPETRQLVEEVAALSDKIGLGIYDLQEDAEIARQYQVDKAPALVLAARDGETMTDLGVSFSGIPAGHEFTSLIQSLLLVSHRDSGLSEASRSFLKNLDRPLRLQVFVTPTCPYCPRAVVLAHSMAMENPLIRAEMIEATEFPELADRHGVHGVPHTAINDGQAHVIGAVPEADLLAEIQKVLA